MAKKAKTGLPESNKTSERQVVGGKVPSKKVAKKKKTTSATLHPIEPKEERFCQEFIVDNNSTQAALRAEYGGKNKNAKVASVQAARLLAKDRVRDKIAELKKAQFKRLEIESDTLLKEALRIATADVGLAFNLDGTLKVIHDIPEDVRRAISGFEVEELFAGRGGNRKQIGTLKKVKFWSKDSNIETLMKHKGLFERDNKQKNEALTSLLGLIDGSSSGKLPSPDEAGE